MRRICLIAALCALLTVSGCGVEPSREPVVEPRPSNDPAPEGPADGRWHPAPLADRGLTAQQREAVQRLEALPYLSGSRPAPPQSGVTRLVRGRVQPGFNLYNSGHAPEALLIDLEGNVLHRWSYPIERIWPDQPRVHQASYWRRVTWLPDGDVLAVFEGIGLIRIDRDSRLKWAYRGPVHHQAVLDADGSVWSLIRRHHVVPRVNPDQPILEDHLLRLTPDGRPIEEVSLLEAFENSSHSRLLKGMKTEGDIFHTNSIEVLDGRFPGKAPWLRRGNLLLSIFFLDTVFVFDPVARKVVWALNGTGKPGFRGPHDPRLLGNGRLLLFDNAGRGGKSKVIEFDPLTLRVFWSYPQDTASEFFTPTCGASQRLANGNTLITESDKGRAFEVTREGEIVWEFLNPHRAGPQNELIATLFEVRRVSEDYHRWEFEASHAKTRRREK